MYSLEIYQKRFLLSGLFYTVMMLNVFYPMVRFESHLMNLIFIEFVLAMPFLFMYLSVSIKKKILRWVGLIFFGLMGFISFLFIGFIGLTILLYDEDHSDFKRIHSVQLKDYEVNVYQTNGGATTSFGVRIIQEKKLFLGIKLVKELYAEYRRENVDIEIENGYLYFDDKKIKLRDYVYF